MRITTATVGKGKAIHIYYPGADRTDCATGGMSDSAATPVDAPVTCKRCLKALAAMVEEAHAEAATVNASLRPAVRPSRAHRATARRAQEAKRRELARTVRARHAAARRVATGQPQSARTWLLAAGMDAKDAKRFAGPFSRGQQADATGTTVIKLKGRATAVVPVKLYSRPAATARLAVYRPADRSISAKLARSAALFHDAILDTTVAADRLAAARLRAA